MPHGTDFVTESMVCHRVFCVTQYRSENSVQGLNLRLLNKPFAHETLVCDSALKLSLHEFSCTTIIVNDLHENNISLCYK